MSTEKRDIRRWFAAEVSTSGKTYLVGEKKRLPVLSSTPSSSEDEGEAPRPGWHWVVLGVVLTFAAWVPLAWLATAFTRALILPRFGFPAEDDPAKLLASLDDAKRTQIGLAMAIPQALGAAASAAGAGFVVGRFGTNVKMRQLVALGVVVSTIALLPALRSGGLVVMALVVFVLLVPATTLGGWFGLKKRA